MADSRAGIVGREGERSLLHEALASPDDRVRAACLVGPAGVGKTTLWASAAAEAANLGYRVVSSRPAPAEVRHAFAGLHDLLHGAVDDVAPGLPDPQRQALDVALLRSEPRSGVDHRLVSVAVLNVLRALVRQRHLCIAIDDLQWLDRPTRRVLTHAVRRVEGGRLRLVLTERREGGAPDPQLLEWVDADALCVVHVQGLPRSALREVLRRRLGDELPPATVARIVELAGGNPMFALEIARAVARGETEGPVGTTLPLPERIHRLLRNRLSTLPEDARLVLAAGAVSHPPTVDVVRAAVPAAEGALRRAIDARVVAVHGGRISFSHPLIATAAYRELRPPRRRWLHHRLSEVSVDPEQRARHLALATVGVDGEVARELDAAAAVATSRGAPEAAAELLELAAQLTPSTERSAGRRRRLDAADRHFDIGNLQRSRELLEGLAAEDLPRALRADVLFRQGLIAGYGGDLTAAMGLFGRSVDAAGDDVARRCVAEQALTYAQTCRADFRPALERARKTLEAAERVGDPSLLIFSLINVAWASFVLGHGVRTDLLDRAVALEQWADPLFVERHPRFLRGAILRYTGDLAAAREDFRDCLSRSREAGEYAKIPSVAWHLTELECWAGDVELADAFASEATGNARSSGSSLVLAYALYARAVVELQCGREEGVRRAVAEGLALAEQAGDAVSRLLLQSALGALELALGDARAAHAVLAPLVPMTDAVPIREPGLLAFVPDAVEALTVLGEVEQAEALLQRFQDDARRLQRLPALATAARCRALVHAARGDLVAAHAACDEAVDLHALSPRPVELARTLMVRGAVQRRLRQKRAPRASFAAAHEVADAAGAAFWRRRARRELDRAARPDEQRELLTPIEKRIAALAAGGRSNREIAAEVSLSTKTVEAHLTRVYRKLGVRSRTELSARWSAEPVEGVVPP